MRKEDIAVLIPAYKPDAKLNTFIDSLTRRGFTRIVVVDDGGGAGYAPIFEQCRAQGAQVVCYSVNRGKGAALRAGMAAIKDGGAVPIITADCDGQHHADDIQRMAIAMLESPDSLLLGTRSKAEMPPRSWLGNSITCAMLGLLTGLWIGDTQTGLRGIPLSALDDFLSLDGDRYEYELNVLIRARQLGMSVVQLGIKTIYIDDNKGSHFNTLKDSARIYALLFAQIGRYVGSGMVSALFEYGLLIVLHMFWPESMLACVVVPRVFSSLLNYIVNRQIVFKSQAGKRSLLSFYGLVAVVLGLNYLLVWTLQQLGLSILAAKPMVDLVLFVLSYNVQQRFIFKDR